MGSLFTNMLNYIRAYLNFDRREDFGNRYGQEVYKDAYGEEFIIETFDDEPQRIVRNGKDMEFPDDKDED